MNDQSHNQEDDAYGIEPMYPENKDWFEEGIKAIEQSLANHQAFLNYLAEREHKV